MAQTEANPVSAPPASPAPAPTLAQSAWRRACQFLTAVFYRRREVSGLENLPAQGPVILCANHVNALVDALVVQATCPRPVHPMARSGLFRNPLLAPLLTAIQAVPIYRRRAGQEKASANNADSFRRCYEYLEQGRMLLVFPEGQSHSDPMLRPLKTGAARLVLGHGQRHGAPPTVLPVGLTFPQKGRFRGEILVQYGKPVPLATVTSEDVDEDEVHVVTEAIEGGLENVTLNVDSWEDLELMRLLQHFFLLRRGRGEDPSRERAPPGAASVKRPRKNSLAARFRALKRLIESHRWLRRTRPDELRLLREKLKQFEQLCKRYGVRDYHLDLRYRPSTVARFGVRFAVFALLVFPLALWGFVNSALPYFATRWTTRRAARGRDQYDTAGMLFGLVFFLLFWGAQTLAVLWFWGIRTAVAYAVSLVVTSAIALMVGKERKRLTENVRIFFLFMRQRQLRDFLRGKRQELEVDVTRLERLTQRELEETGAYKGM